MTRRGRRTAVAVAVVAAAVALAVAGWRGGGSGDEGRLRGASGTVDGARSPASLAAADPAASTGPRRGESDAVPPRPVASTPVVGRVVGEHRRPIDGATVTLRAPPLPAAVVRTGPDGRFRFEGAAPEQIYVFGTAHVEAGRGSGAMARVAGWSGRTVDVGTVEATEAVHVLPFRVTDGGVPVPGAAWDAWTFFPGENWFVRIGEGTTDAAGAASVPPVPPGLVYVFARSDAGRRALARATLPRSDAAPLAVALEPERVVAVEAVEVGTGGPVPGASVRVRVAREQEEGGILGVVDYPVAVDPTDGAGRTTIRGLHPGEELEVWLRAPGLQPAVGRVEPTATSVRVLLRRARRLEWTVVAGERPVPPDGTVVALTRWPTFHASEVPEQGRMDRGRLVVDGLEGQREVHALAVAPDGSLAELHHEAVGDSESRGQTSFQRPRRLDVRVVDETGRGVPGARLLPRVDGEDWPPVHRTNADGAATIAGLPARRRVGLRALVSEHGLGGLRMERDVDLATTDAAVEIRVGAERDVTALVRMDGRAGLPTALSLGFFGVDEIERHEDADEGTVRLRVRPYDVGSRGSFGVEGQGFLPFRGEFDWPPPGGALTVRADLVRAARLDLNVRARADAEIGLVVESQEAGGRWSVAGVDLMDPPGRQEVGGLAPGTYRVRDVVTGLFSESVVLSGPGAVPVDLDLSGSFEVSGRVEVPRGYDTGRVRVVPVGSGIDMNEASTEPSNDPDPSLQGTPVDTEDGTFRVVVARRGVALEVRHPELRGESVAVPGPRSDLVLRLFEGPRAVLRLPPVSASQQGSSPPVLLYPREPGGVPAGIHALHPPSEGSIDTAGGWWFAGFRPGTYTLWVDLPPFAPKALRGVALGSGLTDLGDIALDAGSTAEIRVLVPPGRDAPRLQGSAHREGDPRYSRRVEQDGARARIRGLGPGRFEAWIAWSGDVGREVVRRTFEVDGRTEVVLDLDLR